MKQFVFSATYRGNPRSALDLLLDPSRFVRRMPHARCLPVDKRSIAEKGDIEGAMSSWEIDIDGVKLRWLQRDLFYADTQSVRFQMVRGDFERYEGEWTVFANGEEVRLSLSVNLDWGASCLSKFVYPVLEQKAERAIRGLFLTVARQASRRRIQDHDVRRRFGFIFHPLDLDLLANGFGDEDLRKMRKEMVEGVMTWLPPFRRGILTGIQSRLGDRIEGDMILLPLLPSQMLSLGAEFIMGKLLEACRLAERYGDKIIGLGAYAANVGRKGVYLSKHLRTPITTGSSYTVATTIEASIEACRLIGVDLADSTVVVIGATGTIGRVCAQLMAKQAKQLILVSRSQQRLQEVADSLSGGRATAVIVETCISRAIKTADLVIVATNTPTPIFEITDVRPGTVICDVSRPRNVSRQTFSRRGDVLVVDGGVVKPPGSMNLPFDIGLPTSLVYACLAETMILSLEGRYESYSLGGDVDLAKVEEIAQLGRKHGFALTGVRSFDREVSQEQIQRVSLARRRGR